MGDVDQRLAERWHRVLAAAGPEPLSDETEVRVHALAEQAMRLLALGASDAHRARQLGSALYEIGGAVPDVTPELQEAWLTVALETLPADQRSEKQPVLIRLGGELALGYWSAYLNTRCVSDAASVQRLRHDLKTPINSITGFSKVILKGIDGPINDLQREDLTTVFESGKRLLEMIDDVTGIMERDTLNRETACDVVDVAALMGDLMTTLQPLLAARGHQLRLEIAGEVGRFRLSYAQMRWALFGLVLTIGHVSEKASIDVLVRRTLDGDDDRLVFEVTGSGVSSDVNAEDFEEALRRVPTQGFCESVGGVLKMTMAGPHQVRAEMYLPVEVA